MAYKPDIQSLVDDLQPVQILHQGRALAVVLAVVAGAAALIVGGIGLREDVAAGEPSPMFLLRGGILLLLGIVNVYAVLGMASPSVGKQWSGWKVALAAALLFPLAAIVIATLNSPMPAIAAYQSGIECLTISVLAALITAIPVTMHLRRGAPTSLARAGWLTGIASGGLGAFAYSLHCPANSVVYIGLWYGLAVGLCAIAARIIVPRIIRW